MYGHLYVHLQTIRTAGGEDHNVPISTKAEVGCPQFSGEVCRCEFWGGPTMALTIAVLGHVQTGMRICV